MIYFCSLSLSLHDACQSLSGVQMIVFWIFSIGSNVFYTLKCVLSARKWTAVVLPGSLCYLLTHFKWIISTVLLSHWLSAKWEWVFCPYFIWSLIKRKISIIFPWGALHRSTIITLNFVVFYSIQKCLCYFSFARGYISAFLW